LVGSHIVEYLADGGTREAIESLANGAEPVSLDDVIGGPVLVCMADVEARDVAWQWKDRIHLGRLTLLAGRPGEGKSFLTMDATARVTKGRDWPDAMGGIVPPPCQTGSVILIAAEDNAADIIKPRLDACEADCRKVHQMTMVNRIEPQSGKLREYPFTLADVTVLEKALRRMPDCKLVVIDPIGSFIGGKTDAHRDNAAKPSSCGSTT
jgi:RecA-family ATPase